MMQKNGIPVDEAIENNIARISRMLRHSCVTARNGFVADGLRRQYTQDMADILAQANALDLHYGVTQLQVFCVSSISYDMIMQVDDSVQVEAKQEMLKAFASKKKRGTTSYEHDDDDEENDEELMEEGEGGNNDLAATSEAQEKLNDFLTQIMQDDRADDGEDIAPEALRQRMEREAKEIEELRQSRVESSTQSLQERTVYLNKVIKTNNVAAATLSKFIDSISCVQGQKTVASDRRIQIWKSQVQELVDSNTSTATATGSNGNAGAAMIAVLGDSGSGKSSLLNALLVPKSDGILPVSGARACTAAPIEIAYHASREFEAKVEFLKKDEWYPELELLLGDLADENGNLKKNMMRPSSENGRIAYDKVMSVYGRIATFDELTRKGGLMEGRLGSVVTLRASTEEGIRSRLEAFVSSKTSRSDVILESEVGRLWPIVKYAVLSGPFPLLADSGGRLLDLPGLQDANAARNAVVEAFLTKCTGFLIAAPIKRAVDNKTAKDLLGRQFRRQLFIDGRMGSIAFAATQTDDLECFKVLSELGLEGVSAYSGFSKEVISDTIKTQRPIIKEINKKISAAAKKHASYERKLKSVRKKINKIEEDSDGADRTPLRKLIPLSTRLSKNITEVNKALSKLSQEVKQREHIINQYCALARNEFARIQLRQDFTDGIREIIESSLTSADIEIPLLPVFTVSSRDYKVLCRNRTQDAAAFYTTDQTGVPQLFNFCRQNLLVSRINAEADRTDRIDLLLSSVIQYLTLPKRATPSQQLKLSRSIITLNTDVGSNLSVAVEKTKVRLQSVLLDGPLKETLAVGDEKARHSARKNLSNIENKAPFSEQKQFLAYLSINCLFSEMPIYQ
ncbi:hypothetical protein BCR33DRAFT_5462 [Rhizoclosmatium globosum]|uniref:Dynamin N-terminal domain-containing protein n=1 Tax=Rhizoclosmatium globosum TaxID=329046 RepID=A0A1Y2D368_9FUNG|nr:hypothetical protein BCR33DRAFT_5462 [Rhizoclosmatium globosum]|eukprot:ORY53657.1 hypothetical protein BCR33DRAFT_5462 [Rhizoclosmatium globosum]